MVSRVRERWWKCETNVGHEDLTTTGSHLATAAVATSEPTAATRGSVITAAPSTGLEARLGLAVL